MDMLTYSRSPRIPNFIRTKSNGLNFSKLAVGQGLCMCWGSYRVCDFKEERKSIFNVCWIGDFLWLVKYNVCYNWCLAQNICLSVRVVATELIFRFNFVLILFSFRHSISITPLHINVQRNWELLVVNTNVVSTVMYVLWVDMKDLDN